MNRIHRFNPIVAMACIFALVFTLAVPMPALAKKPKTPKATMSLGWDNVLKLKKGDRVIVTLFSKRLYQGRVERVDPTAIGISLGKKQSSLLVPKEDIRIVALDKKHNAIKTGAILEVAGAAALVGLRYQESTSFTNCFNKASSGLGSSTPGTSTTCEDNPAVAVAVGGGVAGAGAALQIFGRAPRLLYQVEAPPQAESPAQ